MTANTEPQPELLKLIQALSDQIDGLRTVNIILAVALARQPALDVTLLLADVAGMIESNHEQGAAIPMPVLDFHAELTRAIRADRPPYAG